MVKALHFFMPAIMATFASACDMLWVDGKLSDEYNDFSYAVGDIVTNDKLCLSQGPGSYTFAMMTQSGSLGLTDSGTSGTSFAIMDNYCKLLGIYATDTMHCGAPFTLEASFLQYVLTLETVWADVGGSSFSFAYANGQYLTGNNGCGCDTISNKGNGAVVGCKCAFPVAGEPKKSKREFIA